MNKFIDRYKLLLAVIAAMTFLPIHNLFAYDWDEYYTCWESETDDFAYGQNHYYTEIDTDADRNHNPEYSGIYIDGFVEVYTEADIYSDGEEYSNSFSIYGVAEIGAERDYEWDGPPATAPGADIYGTLSTSAEHHVYGARYPSQITAETDASSFTEGWAEAMTADSGNGYDYCTAEMSAQGFVDSDDSDVGYSIFQAPDLYYWTNAYNNDFAYAGKLTWSYSSSFSYEVSSGLAWFLVEACAHVYANSDASIDADESELNEETWAVSSVCVDITSAIGVTLN